jgi:hypothetical protein
VSNYDRDPIDLVGQERQKAERASRERLLRETERDDIKWLMKSGKGRRIVWRLLDLSGVNSGCFSTNALQMAFNEGNRHYGNFLQAQMVAICPDEYVLMLKEQWPKEKVKNGRDDGSGENTN